MEEPVPRNRNQLNHKKELQINTAAAAGGYPVGRDAAVLSGDPGAKANTTINPVSSFVIVASPDHSRAALSADSAVEASLKSPRIAFSAYRSCSISYCVRIPMLRNTGSGGHHPCIACCM